MKFFSIAWTSAAGEYGRQRAEKYGRVAKIWRSLQILACLALTAAILLLWHTRPEPDTRDRDRPAPTHHPSVAAGRR